MLINTYKNLDSQAGKERYSSENMLSFTDPYEKKEPVHVLRIVTLSGPNQLEAVKITHQANIHGYVHKSHNAVCEAMTGALKGFLAGYRTCLVLVFRSYLFGSLGRLIIL